MLTCQTEKEKKKKSSALFVHNKVKYGNISYSKNLPFGGLIKD